MWRWLRNGFETKQKLTNELFKKKCGFVSVNRFLCISGYFYVQSVMIRQILLDVKINTIPIDFRRCLNVLFYVRSIFFDNRKEYEKTGENYNYDNWLRRKQRETWSIKNFWTYRNCTQIYIFIIFLR